jgi:ATP-dependent helicase HrpB
VRDLGQFGWFEPPRPDALARADNLLEMLGATDDRGVLTRAGRRLAAFPLHPRLGRLLLAGADAGLLREAATLAAMLSEKDILADPHLKRRRPAAWDGSSDLLDRLDLFEHHRLSGEVDPQAAAAVERVRDELIQLIRKTKND